tara:strand:- start:864 stop:2117 length:1254 start_codon:yes stop_codon:yes gene_type:complete
MNKLFNKITVIFITIIITLGYSNISIAADHTAERQLIKELKKEIIELGGDPVKKKGLFSKDKKWIIKLQQQLEELIKNSESEKEKRAAIEAVKKEILKELEALGVKPKIDTKDIDTNEEIIELRKLLDDSKKKAAIEAVKKEILKELEALGAKPITDTKDIDTNEEIIELRKQLEEIKEKAEEKKIAEEKKKAEEKVNKEKKQTRDKAIQSVKKEILFLGETPISEFEVNNEDQYIAALKEQFDEIKKLKEQKEKEIQESIPTWFIKIPKGTEKIIYVRGTAVVDTLQGSIDSATNAALRELGKKLETRLNSKVKETVRQAGIGEDQITKSEMNRVSTIIVKEVTISGYEISETKMVKLDNGSYRSFILLEYPVAHIYKAFINRIEQNPAIKSNLSAIKDTETFKELEEYVSQFTGA